MRSKMQIILRILKLYVSMFNKRDPQLMVFGSWWGEKYADNSKYLYLRAIERGLNAYWITNDKTVYCNLKEYNLPVAMRDSAEGINICKKAGVYFFSTSLKDISDCYCGGAILINLWHGIPLKKIMYDNRIDNDDYTFKGCIRSALTAFPTRKKYVVSTSDRVTRIYKSAFRCGTNHILQWGQPRNDCFFNGTLTRKKYLNKEYRYLILYMPTHRNEGEKSIDITHIFDLERLNGLCKDNNVLFLIKKHFYHRNEYEDLSAYSNIADCIQDTLDTQELLYNADVLVTDYSSCFIDYLLLNRPVLLYAYDYEQYLISDREMYFDFRDIAPGPISYKFDSLYENLKEAIDGQDNYITKRNGVKDLFYDKANQGIVADKILDAVLSSQTIKGDDKH